MQVFRYNAAKVGCGALGDGGLMQAIYSGPVCAGAFGVLSPQVLRATGCAKALLIRMDGCLTLMARPLQVQDDQERAPEGCVVVRADQLDFWVNYAADMALRGVRRVVFLDSQIQLALMWLDRRSSSRDQLVL